MGSKPTLYELLGVSPQAGVLEIQTAYQKKVGLLEQARGSMSPQNFDEKNQLLRVALSTLADSAARLSYDAKLNAQEPGRPPAALVARAAPAPVPPSAQAQADALALRADALSLRADAMMIRAGINLPDEGASGVVRTVASGTVTLLKRVVSAIGLLVIVGTGFYMATRSIQGDPSVRRSAMEIKASEQVALQEYYQAHGVRPASMAELELLQADQRRRENENNLGKQDRDKQEREARQFEEESRQIAEKASTELRLADEAAKREAERQIERQRYDDLRKIEVERQKAEAEQRRIERQEAQWQSVLRR